LAVCFELKVTDDVTAAAEQECGAGRAVSECNGEVRSYGRSCKERQISPAVADVVINKQRRHLMAAAPKITKHTGAETKDHSMAADPNDKCLDARCAAVSLTLLSVWWAIIHLLSFQFSGPFVHSRSRLTCFLRLALLFLVFAGSVALSIPRYSPTLSVLMGNSAHLHAVVVVVNDLWRPLSAFGGALQVFVRTIRRLLRSRQLQETGT
jgi:hypothetical protein